MSKPREFWLEFSEEGSGDKIFTRPPPYKVIHVIEKSAYDAVVRERDEAIFQRDHWEKSFQKACRERDELRAELLVLKTVNDMESMTNTKSVYSGTHVMELYDAERARSTRLVEAARNWLAYEEAQIKQYGPYVSSNIPHHMGQITLALAEFERDSGKGEG